jgi:hypothetical protein
LHDACCPSNYYFPRGEGGRGKVVTTIREDGAYTVNTLCLKSQFTLAFPV